jgi:hypothetical protein
MAKPTRRQAVKAGAMKRKGLSDTAAKKIAGIKKSRKK